MDLMRLLRESINNKRFNEFLAEFMCEQYKKVENVPQWVKDALNYSGYDWQF
jgi:queuine/archaeosine tRNA-ribosyltransferase